MLQKNNLLGLINDPIHKPVTLFWPTDTAIRGLPQEQQDFLFKKSNTDKLVQYLKFHIVRDAAVRPRFLGAVPRPRDASPGTCISPVSFSGAGLPAPPLHLTEDHAGLQPQC